MDNNKLFFIQNRMMKISNNKSVLLLIFRINRNTQAKIVGEEQHTSIHYLSDLSYILDLWKNCFLFISHLSTERAAGAQW